MEHCQLWGGVKGVPVEQAIADAAALLTRVGLSGKKSALAKSLSGGQKRKLCIVLALMGNPSLLLLDEPTTGVDATSRREVWQVLHQFQQHSPGLAILLSTHHMDEAELLAQHIIVLGNGKVQASGTPWSLKKRFNVGYVLSAELSVAAVGSVEQLSTARLPGVRALAELVQNHIPAADLAKCEFGKAGIPSVPSARATLAAGPDQPITVDVRLLLPIEAQPSFGPLFTQLQQQESELGVLAYGLSLTSLEHAVLQLFAQSPAAFSEPLPKVARLTQGEDSTNSLTALDSLAEVLSPSSQAVHQLSERELRGRVLTGTTLKLQQIRAVYTQRRLSESNRCIYWAWMMFAPVVNVVIVLLLAAFVTSQLHSAIAGGAEETQGRSLAWDTSNWNGNSPMPAWVVRHVAASRQAHMDETTGKSDLIAFTAAFLPSGNSTAWLPSQQTPMPVPSVFGSASTFSFDFASNTHPQLTVVFSESQASGLMLSTALVDQAAILNTSAVRTAQVRLAGSTMQLPQMDSNSSQLYEKLGAGLRFVFMLVLVQMLTSSFMRNSVTFAGHAASMRADGVQDMVFSMGCQSPTYWFAQWMFDATTAVGSVAFLGILLLGAVSQGLMHPAHVLPLSVLVALFAAGTPLLGYAIGAHFKESSLAQQWAMRAVVIQLQVALLLSILITVLTATEAAAHDEANNSTISSLWVLKLVAYAVMVLVPSTAMLVGGFALTLTEPLCLLASGQHVEEAASSTGDCHAQTHLNAWGTILVPAVLLILGSVLWFALLVLQDRSARAGDGCCSSKNTAAAPTREALGDADVRAEGDSVGALSNPDARRSVVLRGLRKVFQIGSFWKNSDIASTTVAVDNISLQLAPARVFGLLGHNGAGKTSLINMLAGVVVPSGGSATFFGRHSAGPHATSEEVEAARHMLGFCPQANALFPLMTGTQVLSFYARVKGLPEPSIVGSVQDAAASVGVEEHMSKQTRELSGGNKRKLCLAVAYLGAPSVVLLDEPSSGMDAAAAQKMRELVRSRRQGRVTVVTTHVMHEADALSDRLGIMVRGQLVCLGSSQHLKARYGAGYTIELLLQPAGVDPARDGEDSHTATPAGTPISTASTRSAALVQQHGNILSAMRLISPDAAIVGSPTPEQLRIQLWHTNPELAVGSSMTQQTDDAITAVLRTTVGTVRLGALFEALQAQSCDLGIQSYTVGQTDLEAVFLSFSSLQQRLEAEESAHLASSAMSQRRQVADLGRLQV
jgi:ABC-type multidrug transport system ATPase subunit